MALCRANGFANAGAHGLGEDFTDACRLFAQDVRVDPQCHGRVSVSEPGSDDVDRDACQQQRRRVQVAKIVQPGVGERPGRWRARLKPRASTARRRHCGCDMKVKMWGKISPVMC